MWVSIISVSIYGPICLHWIVIVYWMYCKCNVYTLCFAILLCTICTPLALRTCGLAGWVSPPQSIIVVGSSTKSFLAAKWQEEVTASAQAQEEPEVSVVGLKHCTTMLVGGGQREINDSVMASEEGALSNWGRLRSVTGKWPVSGCWTVSGLLFQSCEESRLVGSIGRVLDYWACKEGVQSYLTKCGVLGLWNVYMFHLLCLL